MQAQIHGLSVIRAPPACIASGELANPGRKTETGGIPTLGSVRQSFNAFGIL